MSSTYTFLTAALGYKAGEVVTVSDAGQIAFLNGFRYALRTDDDSNEDALLGVIEPPAVEVEEVKEPAKRKRHSVNDPSDDPTEDEIVID